MVEGNQFVLHEMRYERESSKIQIKADLEKKLMLPVLQKEWSGCELRQELER